MTWKRGVLVLKVAGGGTQVPTMNCIAVDKASIQVIFERDYIKFLEEKSKAAALKSVIEFCFQEQPYMCLVFYGSLNPTN